MEEEGGAVVSVDFVDLSEKDGVVAGLGDGDEFAVELDDGGFEEGSAAFGDAEFNAEAFEFGGVLFGLGEEAGPGFVVFVEEIDAEEFMFLDERVSFGTSVDADEDLEGFEGDGGEGVGGHAMDARVGGMLMFAHDGEDGDAGGELGQGFAKFVGGEWGHEGE